jgi:hypothetical protein
MRHLTTCARCGGTAAWTGSGYEHVAGEPVHAVVVDDGHISGPDRDDLPPCSGCRHPEHDEGECEEEVSTGLYGSDGVRVYTYCACIGPVPAVLGPVSPDPWLDPDAAAAAVPPPF